MEDRIETCFWTNDSHLQAVKYLQSQLSSNKLA